MANDIKERGEAIRKRVLGTVRFQQTAGSATPFDRPFQDFVTEYCWGASWGRGVLPEQQRSMLTLAMRPPSGGRPSSRRISVARCST